MHIAFAGEFEFHPLLPLNRKNHFNAGPVAGLIYFLLKASVKAQKVTFRMYCFIFS